MYVLTVFENRYPFTVTAVIGTFETAGLAVQYYKANFKLEETSFKVSAMQSPNVG